ncbi:MAG: hypothetical protein HQ481_03375 [Alphaproteobacteria bacterium]|nr:hypothetical protein [Alphaproteobacteria bacterium]
MKYSVIPACLVVLGGVALASASVAAQPDQYVASINPAQAAGKQAMPPIAAAPTSPTPSTAPLVAPRLLTQIQASPVAASSAGGHGESAGDDVAMRAMYVAMGAMAGFVIATMPVTVTTVTTAVAAGTVTMWAYDYFNYPALPVE